MIIPTKAQVHALAANVERSNYEMLHARMSNNGTTAGEKFASAAAFRIAQNKHERLEREYTMAFDAWASAGFPETVTGEGQ